MEFLDKIPTFVQQLQFTVKSPTVGKAATFTKVDHVIQGTKTLMNTISKVVSTCYACSTKVCHIPLCSFSCSFVSILSLSSGA